MRGLPGYARRGLRFVAAIVFVLAACAGSASAAPPLSQPMPGMSASLYRAWMAEGLKREAARQWGAAEQAFRTVLQYEPRSGDASYHLARCLAQSGNAAEAEQTLSTLLAHEPDRAEAVLLLARLMRGRGKAADAAGVLSAYIQRHPNDPRMLGEAGSAWLAAGHPDRAAAALEKAIAAGDKTPGLRKKLGLAYLAMKKLAAAEPQLRAALNEKPGDMEAALALAGVYAAGQRWLEVVMVTQTQVSLAPKDPRPWWPMADAYGAMADVTSCANALGWAIRLSPAKDQRKAAMQALSLAFGRNLPEVVTRLADLKVLPSDPDVLAAEAQALEGAMRWADAAKLYEQAGASRPELMSLAARCWTAAGNNARALECLGKAATSDPAALMSAVKLALAMKRPDLAERYLRRVLALSPGDVELHLALTEMLSEYGETWQALLQAQEARGKAGAEAVRIMAGLYERASQTEAAAQAYAEAWRRGHKIEDAENAARLMRRLGQWDRMAKLLVETPKLTPRLKLSAAWLALHEKEPARALQALTGLTGPEAAEVRASAFAAKGDLLAAVDAVGQAWNTSPDRDGLCAVLRQAAGDAAARDKALNLVPRMVADTSPTKAQWAAVEALLTAEYGPQGRLKALHSLATAAGAPMAMIRYAAEQMAAGGEAAGAAALADQTAQAAPDREVKGQLLALAAQMSLAADKLPQAADYMLRAAALRDEPILVGRFTVMKKTGQAALEVREAMGEVAAAWADDAPDAPAVMALLAAGGDEAQLQAWVNSDRGTPADKALRQAQALMLAGKPDLALTYLAKASPGPITRRAQIAALIKAGRASEANAPAEALLRYGPTPQDLVLVGDVALAMQEYDNALWWYARAVVEGAGGPAVVKLEQTAQKAGTDSAALEAITAAARQATKGR